MPSDVVRDYYEIVQWNHLRNHPSRAPPPLQEEKRTEEFCPFVQTTKFSPFQITKKIQLDNVRTIPSGAVWALWSRKVYSPEQNVGTIQEPVWVQCVSHHKAMIKV